MRRLFPINGNRRRSLYDTTAVILAVDGVVCLSFICLRYRRVPLSHHMLSLINVDSILLNL